MLKMLMWMRPAYFHVIINVCCCKTVIPDTGVVVPPTAAPLLYLLHPLGSTLGGKLGSFS